MRITNISVTNFKAISRLVLEDLKDTVVIAGANGSGKSCLFDAIRLLKSAYGGYQPNEWNSWFGEFQIRINSNDSSLLPLFQDRNKRIEITAQFSFTDSELAYMRSHAEQLLSRHVENLNAPPQPVMYQQSSSLATTRRFRDPKISKTVNENLDGLLQELATNEHTGRYILDPNGRDDVTPSRVLELVFGNYDPQHIGIIDYHGATRTFNREQVGGISLSIDSTNDHQRQHALYNHSNKYNNLKTEMAGSYVRQLIASKAKEDSTIDQSLNETLKELFKTFFPGKEFRGPEPTSDGKLRFQIYTRSGHQHDIDELSSGEKEVLYGYLRLRNSAPRNSILLIDEPELHLNPRLISGLASFYHRHLGQELGAQIWLITHSDTLIREAIGQSGFSVYHMQQPTRPEGDNQATIVHAAADVDRLVIELVGDLAAYRPNSKIVIFEGENERDPGFDVSMTSTLFPEFAEKANRISGGNKRLVHKLYDLLDKSSLDGSLSATFYAITDRDSEPHKSTANPRRFTWDSYHIENYLLEPVFILQVLRDIGQAKVPVSSDVEILEALRKCASDITEAQIAHKSLSENSSNS